MDESPTGYTGPRMYPPKKCSLCGGEFYPRGANNKRCVACCTMKCVVCGATWFDPKGSHPCVSRPKKYCGKPECKAAARTGEWAPAALPASPPAATLRACPPSGDTYASSGAHAAPGRTQVEVQAGNPIPAPPLGRNHAAPKPEAIRPPPEAPASEPSVLDRLLKTLRKRPASTDQLAAVAGIAPRDVRMLLLGAQAEGHNVLCMGDEWSVEAAPQVGAGAIAPYVSRADGSYVFGFIGDTHFGSKYARLDVAADLYRRFKALGVDRVFHTGNWIDGEARFNKYDLLVHGMDGQVRYLVENYPHADGLATYAVTGDDHEGWYCQSTGVDIGKYAENAFREAGRRDWVNLGYMEAYVPLRHAASGAEARMLVMHPGGGSSYAVSYTMQKIAEGFGEGEKPAVMLAGHYHKAEFINVRGIHAVQTACCQDQTPFMRKKKIHVTVGGGVMYLVQNPETGAIEDASVRSFIYFNRGYYENQKWSMSGPVVQPRRV